jgi:erythromycin esterase-like protein
MNVSRRSRRLLVPVIAIALLATGTATVQAATDDPVAEWVEDNATALRSTDPAAPLDDLAHLRHSVGGATIVGIGESQHGTAEQTALKLRTLRFLVEKLGFRSIAWEDDWTLGVLVNEYLQTGRGDLPALVNKMSTAWRSHEVVQVLRWLRSYNATHRDKVRFTGVEYYTTRPLAYDAVEAYVARNAPHRLTEAKAHLGPITPDSDDMKAHLTWYLDPDTDKAPYLAHARAAYDLVKSLPHRPGDRRYAVALHHATQIRNWYEGFSLPSTFAHRDQKAAENLKWWRRYSGDKVVYWAAAAHVADAPQVRYVMPPYPDTTFPTVGSYLRDWYGERYRTIAFTFDHGSLYDENAAVTVPPPADEWFEKKFQSVSAEHFTLDLRRPAARPVRDWLSAQAKTRGFPGGGLASHMTGGSLEQWFDLIIHTRTVTPIHPL